MLYTGLPICSFSYENFQVLESSWKSKFWKIYIIFYIDCITVSINARRFSCSWWISHKLSIRKQLQFLLRKPETKWTRWQGGRCRWENEICQECVFYVFVCNWTIFQVINLQHWEQFGQIIFHRFTQASNISRKMYWLKSKTSKLSNSRIWHCNNAKTSVSVHIV